MPAMKRLAALSGALLLLVGSAIQAQEAKTRF
jgi:hypothetical protein